MIEIIDNKILYDGIEYSILEIEENVLHLINEFGGICILIEDLSLLDELKNINK